MAGRHRMKALLTVACFAALISIAGSTFYMRRRRRRRVAGLNSSELDGKPQSKFKCVIADNSFTSFSHLKRHIDDDDETSMKVHPYEEEITNLLEVPPALEIMAGHRLSNMTSSYVWVNTEQDLDLLANILRKEQVFAVDTEQHSLRSFLGFTALMQISTEKEDFLIDTIALHDSMSILQPIFADSTICKVFHGADNDILWLQRDFHIYIVNMFDTAKACEVLSKQQKSLAYLLEAYCGVTTDKTLQREDWRMRPLPEVMVQYARTDAHYLLYIADHLVSELRSKSAEFSTSADDKLNFFFEASRRSNMICLQLYVKDTDIPPGASTAASLFARNFNFQGDTSAKCSQVKDILWKLSAWRDLVARIHDESLRYVLSDQALVSLAARLPNNSAEICHAITQADIASSSLNRYCSFPSPSPAVLMHMKELCYLLQDTKANLDNVFRGYMQKQSNCVGCLVSPYNYVLLCQLNLKPSKLFSKRNEGKITMPATRRASKALFVQKFSCKAPVYHNCRIYANDGRLLCYCDRRKLEWYLQRNLAKLIEDQPPAIMLLFEPKGRPEVDGNDFYIQSKKNICVGCGEKNHYLRYRIIPSCYRMHFPEHLKSHRSHDIVLLCVDCHEVAHAAAEKYKKQIAAEFGIPLFVQKIVDSGESEAITSSVEFNGIGEGKGVPPLQLRTAAMALLRHGSVMPSYRRDELTQIVREYFGGREITPEDLEMALLVGMNPHERRRLEKKKGISFRHIKGSASNCTSDSTYDVKDTEKITGSGCSSNLSNDLSSKVVGEAERATHASNVDVDPSVDGDPCCIGMVAENFDNLGTTKQSHVDSSANVRNSNLANENGLSDDVLCVQQVSSGSSKKLSLLGHGPHGKQVVEHILSKNGEGGLCQFCQRWRQVFVEAIRPRFLPSGWDIMHSGRREFGEYSIYNPAKKVPLEAES